MSELHKKFGKMKISESQSKSKSKSKSKPKQKILTLPKEVEDLFKKTYMEKKTFDMIKYHANEPLRMEVSYEDDVYICFKRKGEIPVEWRFAIITEDEMKAYLTKGKLPIELDKNCHNINTVQLEKDIDKSIMLVMDMLRKNMKIKMRNLRLETISRMPPSIKKLIEHVSFLEVMHLMGPPKISSRDLNTLFSKLKITKDLSIHCLVSENFVPRRPLKLVADVVEIKTLRMNSWITQQVLLDSSCCEIYIDYCDLSPEDFQKFMVKWFDSTDMRLKLVQVKSAQPIRFNLDEFSPEEWNPDLRGRYYPLPDYFKAIDLKNGQDLTRLDGVMATIQRHRYQFRMFVWHERFPKVSPDFEIMNEENDNPDRF